MPLNINTIFEIQTLQGEDQGDEFVVSEENITALTWNEYGWLTYYATYDNGAWKLYRVLDEGTWDNGASTPVTVEADLGEEIPETATITGLALNRPFYYETFMLAVAWYDSGSFTGGITMFPLNYTEEEGELTGTLLPVLDDPEHPAGAVRQIVTGEQQFYLTPQAFSLGANPDDISRIVYTNFDGDLIVVNDEGDDEVQINNDFSFCRGASFEVHQRYEYGEDQNLELPQRIAFIGSSLGDDGYEAHLVVTNHDLDEEEVVPTTVNSLGPTVLWGPNPTYFYENSVEYFEGERFGLPAAVKDEVGGFYIVERPDEGAGRTVMVYEDFEEHYWRFATWIPPKQVIDG